MIAQLALAFLPIAPPSPAAQEQPLPNGPYQRFHENGTLAAEGTVENGKRVGKWTFYTPDGAERASGKLVKGRRHGPWTFLHANGKTETKGKYSRGKRIAKWSFRDANGKKQAERSGEPGVGQVRMASGVRAIGGFCSRREGPWLFTWPDSTPMLFGEYADGLPTGTWRFWARGADAKSFSAIDTGRPAWDPGFWDLESPGSWLELLSEETSGKSASNSLLEDLSEVARLHELLLSEPDANTTIGEEDVFRLLTFLEGDGNERTPLGERALQLAAAGLESNGAEIPEGGAEAIAERYSLWLLARRDPALRQCLTNLGPQAAGLWLFPATAETFRKNPPAPKLEGRPRGGPRFGGRFGGADAMRKARPPQMIRSFDRAMDWLAENQEPDGTWREERFSIGATASALHAFLGDGVLPAHPESGHVVERGLAALVEAQDAASGALHSPQSADPDYEHALATQTLAEAFHRGRETSTGFALLAALEHCLARREANALWEGPRRSPTTGPIVLALSTAQHAGWQLPQGLYELIEVWLLAEPATVETSRKSLSPDATQAARSQRVFLRMAFGLTKDMTDPAIQSCLTLPKRSARLDPLDLQFRLLVAFQHGGQLWKDWNAYMTDALSSTQEADGSWDPPSRSGIGRVTTTAQNAITLEVMYRFGRLLGGR